MTNREWLRSLTDFQLSQFLTHGIFVVLPDGRTIPVCAQQIFNRYEDPLTGFMTWLNCAQEFIIHNPQTISKISMMTEITDENY